MTELSGSGHDSSYYDDRSDHERERHKEKKKKKKKKSEKEKDKHLDDEERRKRKVNNCMMVEQLACFQFCVSGLGLKLVTGHNSERTSRPSQEQVLLKQAQSQVLIDHCATAGDLYIRGPWACGDETLKRRAIWGI